MAEETSDETHELPIEWYIPDDMASQYTTNMIVRFGYKVSHAL